MLGGRRDVRAEFGVAAGDSIRARDITISGIPPKQLEALVRDRTKSLQDLADTQKTLIVVLQEKLDLNVRQVRAALRPPARPPSRPSGSARRSSRSRGTTRRCRRRCDPHLVTIPGLPS